MEIFRIGEKIVSLRKIVAITEKILNLRALGLSQLEVARRLGIDRSLISRLETVGEIHKGERIAVLGFPVANKTELARALRTEGVEFIFLLTEEERWDFVQSLDGPELLNKIVGLLTELRNFDVVILLGSDQRIRSIRSLLNQEVIEMEIGQSPLKEDQVVPVEELVGLVKLIKSNGRNISAVK